MSGTSEATTVMAGRKPFAITAADVNSSMTAVNPSVSVQQPQHDQKISMSYADVGSGSFYSQMSSSPLQYQSISAGNAVINDMGNSSTGDQKRKRGRPRKYAPDGGPAYSMASSQQPMDAAMQMQLQIFSPTDGGLASPAKRPRGRPRGSSNKKQRRESLGSTGSAFRPHVFIVNAGEDVSSKIMSLSHKDGSRGVCVLSAIGAISSVTLRQAASSGGTATYEGRFDILSLRGSFLLSETPGQKSRIGGLSVLLTGSDGRVLGGCVAGLLIAASPVQVIAGSFLPDGNREPKSKFPDPSSSAGLPNMNLSSGGDPARISSPSGESPSGSSGDRASPLNLSSAGPCNPIPLGMPGMPWK